MLSRSRICANEAEFANARVVTFLNPYSFLKLREAGTDLGRFDKICIDGGALKLFLALVYRDFGIRRLSFDFTSVAGLVFRDAAARAERGFVLGSDEGSNAAFVARIADMFPGIRLEGRAGYFEDPAEQAELLATLARSDHDFVLIGMGAVRQEEIANALVDLGYRGRVYTCGGFVHQTAMSGGEYYPPWVDRCNLRFAYRMLKEPSTVRRYLVDYPRAFSLLVRNVRSFEH